MAEPTPSGSVVPPPMAPEVAPAQAPLQQPLIQKRVIGPPAPTIEKPIPPRPKADDADSDQTVTGDEDYIASDPPSEVPPIQQKKKSKRSERNRKSSLSKAAATIGAQPEPTRRSQRQHLHPGFMRDYLTPLMGEASMSPTPDITGLPPDEKPVPNTVLPFWDARTQRDIHDSDEIFELVHCWCDLREDSGLMVQCENCLTWQHGMCINIATEDEVPDPYICFACKDPAAGRDNKLFRFDQDWLRKGRMAKFEFLKKVPAHHNMAGTSPAATAGPSADQAQAEPDKEKMEQLQFTNQLATLVIDIQDVIKGLNYKQKLYNDPDTTLEQLKPWLEPSTQKDTSNQQDKAGTSTQPDQPEQPNHSEELSEIERCKKNLADHIQETQAQLNSRLDEIDQKVSEMETNMGLGPLQDSDRISYHSAVKDLLSDMQLVYQMARLKP